MHAHIGTSGFSYAEWKGSFYPARLKNADMLDYYAGQLPSVEVNNTFYRLPRKSMLEGWRDKVPDDFRFAVKASRRITHFQKLRETDELVGYLFGVLEALGGKLGPILFQLPPTFRADVPLLENFLSSLPRGTRAAFEFRHPSWFEDQVFGVLERTGAALCGGDLDEVDRSPPLVKTADWIYLRLRRTEYAPADLDAWAERLGQLGVSEIYGYFKHEEQGPHLARGLIDRLAQA